MTNFSQQIARQKTPVYDLRATISNERHYFIVKVDPTKRAAFVKAVEKDEGFTLEDFGEVLHRGSGEPGDELKAQLREQYGMYTDK